MPQTYFIPVYVLAAAESYRRAAGPPRGLCPLIRFATPRPSQPTDIACFASSVPASGGRVETRRQFPLRFPPQRHTPNRRSYKPAAFCLMQRVFAAAVMR